MCRCFGRRSDAEVVSLCKCSGSLRIWVKSSSTCGNLAGAVWSNLSHSFSFFFFETRFCELVIKKKKIKMVTESRTVTNEKRRPEVGVGLCDQRWREGLKLVDLFLCVKEAKMCLYLFLCHCLHLGGQGASRYTPVLFTLAFCAY